MTKRTAQRSAQRDPRLVTRDQAAAYLNVTKQTIRIWLREGRLTELDLGPHRGGISLDELDRIRATWPGGWQQRQA